MCVVFAMLASYFYPGPWFPPWCITCLKRKLTVIAMAKASMRWHGFIWRVHHAFNRQFNRFRNGYGEALRWTLNSRKLVVVLFSACSA